MSRQAEAPLEDLTLWRASVWLRLDRAGDIGPVDSFGFSWPLAFPLRKAPHEPWIVLDFLGFSRPNLDFSMGYVA